ncbi:hypothetical protein EVAR_53141_1 [Eumeta japonica]|uniref:EB domain-containing protein n=1 Tax=Eumeta variegata TaxID=151549 RepID=A0A4C1YB92_EUMVA|nr:hypothetical protein EVAR_53141_1 [Eumeta japonica]
MSVSVRNISDNDHRVTRIVSALLSVAHRRTKRCACVGARRRVDVRQTARRYCDCRGQTCINYLSRTGNVCSVDMDCPDNAFCRLNSYCVCKEGFVYAAVNSTSKGCLKEAQFGEECVQHIQCHSKLGIHSECADSACSCKAGTHLEGTRCFETSRRPSTAVTQENVQAFEKLIQVDRRITYIDLAKIEYRISSDANHYHLSSLIGERCTVSENCYLGDRDVPELQAFCVRGYCSCQLLYSPRDNGSRCVRDAHLGEPCEDEMQCAGAGLECRGTCRCSDGWVANKYTKGCLQSVTALSEPCDYDVQCEALAGIPESPGAALCLAGVCTCAYSARAAGEPTRCWQKKLPGQECLKNEECVSEEDEPGYCHAGRCTCKTCVPDARDFGTDGASSVAPAHLLIMLMISSMTVAILRL